MISKFKRSDPLGQQPGCYYLVCHQIRLQKPDGIDADRFQIGKKGIQLLEVDSIWHAFDWISEKQYQDHNSFCSETVLHGLIKRKAQKNLPWKNLSRQSHLFIIATIEKQPHIIACAAIDHIHISGKSDKQTNSRIRQSTIPLRLS